MSVRSWLYAPGDQPERCKKALASSADQVIWDLEDAVSVDAKPSARQILAHLLHESLPRTPWIRINGLDTPWGSDDLKTLAREFGTREPRWVVPKATSDTIQTLRHMDVPGRWLLIVETAEGLMSAFHERDPWDVPGQARLAFGALDYRNDIDARGNGDESELTVPRSLLVLVSRSWNWPSPIDAVFPEFEHLERLENSARRGRALGMGGKMIIHPAQIEPVHAAFGTTDDEREWAKSVLKAAKNKGVAKVSGGMVDRPLIEKAQRILEDGG